MQCSDGQYISVLRKWNGEQFVCLPEIWRKYFPEVILYGYVPSVLCGDVCIYHMYDEHEHVQYADE